MIGSHIYTIYRIMSSNPASPAPSYNPFVVPLPQTQTQRQADALVCKNKGTGHRFRMSVFAAIFYVILTNKAVFHFVDDLYTFFTQVPNQAISEMGGPTFKGSFTLALVMLVLVFYIY